MGTVTVDGNSYEVYGDLAGAKVYVAPMLGPGAAAFVAAPDTGVAGTVSKSSLLVAARYLLDVAWWQGVATFAGTTLQWPRTGVYDGRGAAVSSASVPTGIINGEYELAIALAADPSIYAAGGPAPIREFATGPERVAYFRPITGSNEETAFPLAVMRWVGQYLERPETRSTSYQADGETNRGNFADSTFGGSQDDVYKRNGPF
jgi:hypothetical protein